MRAGSGINNRFYDELGERWYAGADHPIALLRVEARFRNAWVMERAREAYGGRPLRALDVGCGAGFLANELAAAGHDVSAVDLSESSLAQARAKDATGRVRYQRGDVTRLPYADASFDAVFAMDVLEHVEDLEAAVAEAARVLAPGGRLFYYTFNRNPLSWLLAVQGVRWIANAPENVHVYRLLIKPAELSELCGRHGLKTEGQVGFRPALDAAFWRLVRTRRVQDDFKFVLSRSLAVGYLGVALKS